MGDIQTKATTGSTGTVLFNMGMHRNAVTHDSAERESARYISWESQEQVLSKVHEGQQRGEVRGRLRAAGGEVRGERRVNRREEAGEEMTWLWSGPCTHASTSHPHHRCPPIAADNHFTSLQHKSAALHAHCF